MTLAKLMPAILLFLLNFLELNRNIGGLYELHEVKEMKLLTDNICHKILEAFPIINKLEPCFGILNIK
jgi:hypothetical protein